MTPSSAANFLTIGVTYASACAATGADTGAVTGGADTTGAAIMGATGATTTGATGATGAAGTTPLAEPISPRRAPTGTVESTGTSMARRVPATGDGISVSTLSVETSRSASSIATESPTFFNQRVTVPSLTLSPSAGIVITVPAEFDAGGATGATGVGTTGAGAGVAATGAGVATGAAGAAAPSSIMARSAPTATV